MDSRKASSRQSKAFKFELIKLIILVLLISISIYVIMMVRENYETNFIQSFT